MLAGYPGVTVGPKRWGFSGRFEPLIHRCTELTAAVTTLKQAANTTTDELHPPRRPQATRSSTLCFFKNVLAKDSKNETIEASIDLNEQGLVTYEHHWTLYQAGSIVFSKQMSQDSISFFPLLFEVWTRPRRQTYLLALMSVLGARRHALGHE